MKKSLQLILFLISSLLFSQTQTDKFVQSAASKIKNENYSEALSILADADQNDYRVTYMQIISRYAILQNTQNNINAQAESYIKKYNSKNSSYSKSVSQIIDLLNCNGANINYGVSQQISVEVPISKSEFTPMSYGSDVKDFEYIAEKTKRIFVSPNYSLISNPKSISEFLLSYENRTGENFFKGKVNFCHFYEIQEEFSDGSGLRKMLDLRNGQVYEVPGRECSSGKEEFKAESNVYVIVKCEDGSNFKYTYEWNEYSKKFNEIKKQTE